MMGSKVCVTACLLSSIAVIFFVERNGGQALNVADTFHVHSVAEDTSGRCVCTVMAPSPDICSDDNKYHYIKELEEQVANLTASIQILANSTTAAVDIQDTMLQIQHLTGQLNVLQADREQLLTDQFTIIRDEIIALAGLLPQLEQDREDAELLQLYQNQLDNLTGILGQLEGQHGVSVQDMQQQVLQLTQQLQACQQGGELQVYNVGASETACR
ncbi:noelin-like [Branchiostoma lanceolatum]|uniref:noelin-like n=1 Tax=Branchiostoma lanceolatum TaxID=7740 RepID=UPI003453133B